MGGNIVVIVPDERFEYQNYHFIITNSLRIGPQFIFSKLFCTKKITGQIGQIYTSVPTYQTIAGIFANYS